MARLFCNAHCQLSRAPVVAMSVLSVVSEVWIVLRHCEMHIATAALAGSMPALRASSAELNLILAVDHSFQAPGFLHI